MPEGSTTLDQIELLERTNRNEEEELMMSLAYKANLLTQEPPLEGFVFYRPALQHCAFLDQQTTKRNARTGLIFQLCLLVFLLSLCLVFVIWLLGNDDLMFSFFENDTILFGLKLAGASLAGIALSIVMSVFSKKPAWNSAIELPDAMRAELQSIYDSGNAAKQAIDSGKQGPGFQKAFKEGMVEQAIGLVVPDTVAKLGVAVVGDGDNRSKDRTKREIDGMTKAALDRKFREWSDRLKP